MPKVELSTNDLRYVYSRLISQVDRCLDDVIPAENRGAKDDAQKIARSYVDRAFRTVRHAVNATDRDVRRVDDFLDYCMAHNGVVPVEKNLNDKVVSDLKHLGRETTALASRRRNAATDIVKYYDKYASRREKEFASALKAALQGQLAEKAPADLKELEEASDFYKQASRDVQATKHQLDELSKTLQTLNRAFPQGS